MIRFEHIEKTFNPGTVDESVLFRDFNLKIAAGEFVSVIGSNGSGKTTLLNLLCGTLSPDSGKIMLGDTDLTHTKEHKRAARIGRVFQDPKAGTCSGLTILENMALADNKNKRYSLTPAVNRKRIDSYRTLLEECAMGLENRLHTEVGSLSGGQRQALALVIANMSDIDLLILDEHTAALDPKSSETIMALTDKLVRRRQITTMMVTHNLRFAVEYGSRLIMMHKGSCVLDALGEEKKKMKIENILDIFNSISIEAGNSV